jgi:polysaccharide export outer membrane protein
MKTRQAMMGAARALVLAAAALTAGCAAGPRAGPLATAIDPPDQSDALDGLVVDLTADVATRVTLPPAPGFPAAFLQAGPIDPDRLGPGDVLTLTVWEGGETPLLGGDGGMSRLDDVVIAGSGTIDAPFVGAVRATGATPSQLAARLREALSVVTVAPEVQVSLREPGSRRLTVQGDVARPGLYAIDAATTRLVPMLAQAGGATLPAEQVEVSISRTAGGRGDAAVATGVETLEDIYLDPRLDVALRPDDRLVLAAVRKRFLVLGATSTQREIAFPTRELDLLRAIAAAQGLRDFDANPTGVFVFRFEDRALADTLLSAPQPEALPEGPRRPIVYRLDLSRPEALFAARRFGMRDGDAIFVANAPLTELRKFLQIFTSVLTPVQQTTVLAQ